ncbi:hypothetical protein OBBRIDRAFT_445285 [Obba rivulosa]|uniref:Uncharacterized protein n=1 Tax=Obba rivulosa TaxID=1052685 RepID=A0A8E2DUJ0_9APHY|nr:hypothetical protein OBBRIDRAFT_445285 [Obba rivulosa]
MSCASKAARCPSWLSTNFPTRRGYPRLVTRMTLQQQRRIRQALFPGRPLMRHSPVLGIRWDLLPQRLALLGRRVCPRHNRGIQRRRFRLSWLLVQRENWQSAPWKLRGGTLTLLHLYCSNDVYNDVKAWTG